MGRWCPSPRASYRYCFPQSCARHTRARRVDTPHDRPETETARRAVPRGRPAVQRSKSHIAQALREAAANVLGKLMAGIAAGEPRGGCGVEWAGSASPLTTPKASRAGELGGYDSDASLGSICDFIRSDSESEGEGDSTPRRRRVGECPNAGIRPCCTWIEKHKKRRFPPPCLGRKLHVLDLWSGTGSVERALKKLIIRE